MWQLNTSKISTVAVVCWLARLLYSGAYLRFDTVGPTSSSCEDITYSRDRLRHARMQYAFRKIMVDICDRIYD